MESFEERVLRDLSDIKVTQERNHGEVMLVSQRVTTIEEERKTEKWQRYGFTVLNMLLTGLGFAVKGKH